MNTQSSVDLDKLTPAQVKAIQDLLAEGRLNQYDLHHKTTTNLEERGVIVRTIEMTQEQHRANLIVDDPRYDVHWWVVLTNQFYEVAEEFTERYDDRHVSMWITVPVGG